MDPRLVGDVAALELKEHHVTCVVPLVGKEGCVVVDYRTNESVLKLIGRRALVNIKGPVTAVFASVVAPDQGYDVRLVHHDRASASKPSSPASVAAQRGCCTLIRSAAFASLTGTVGFANNVTTLVDPDPQFGVSPRLVAYFSSFGTTDKSSAQVVITFDVETSGDKTPDFS